MSENRLGRETSPYLLQHKDNPVHWWAWGPEALAEAERTGKPILLSVGYAACHWCHVMAHESFEDPATAAVMNELFVNIKVDREERPDIDAIYMGALHHMGEQGGWPLTMFLDSTARPFWGGTYFPKTGRWGRPAFTDVLRGVAANFSAQPERVAGNAEVLTRALAGRRTACSGSAAPELGADLIRQIAGRLTGLVDPESGGIRGAPKFPQWSFFWLLWRAGIRFQDREAGAAVDISLRNICQGGIYDHLGGGFARYATDERWLVPHFEKMLYDNALLIDLLTEVWRETQEPLFAVRVHETVAWLGAEMIAEGGGFAASLDADSEGEEGRFYVWSLAEILDVLGPEEGRFFASTYGVSAEGNWEGVNILNRLSELAFADPATEERLKPLRDKLLARRAGRVRPGWDDKVLADWNGLAVAAIARAAVIFEQPAWLDLARHAFDFVTGNMEREGRLAHAYRAGIAKAPATASDYANMIWGALRLYEASLEARYLDKAKAWCGVLDRHYWDGAHGGYATSADDTTDVIVRLSSAVDDATPNANAVMLTNLAQLAVLTGDPRYADRAHEIVRAYAPEVAQSLAGHTGLIANLADVAGVQSVVLAGSELVGGSDLWEVVRRTSLPGAFVCRTRGADIAQDLPPFLAGKTAAAREAVAYPCAGPVCEAPISAPDDLRNVLELQRSR